MTQDLTRETRAVTAPAEKVGGLSRRQFLAGSATATLMMMLGAEEIRAAAPPPAAPTGPPIGCGVIGLGLQGRALLTALSTAAGAQIAAVCDSYEPAHKRALEIAPNAKPYTGYKDLLGDNSVSAVFIATPTPLHRQIVEDAVAAGKHVYCEAPLATSLEDAKAIALAGKGSKGIFQAGLQQRANPQTAHVYHFIETDVLGKTAQGRAQWHQRTSWRRAAATPEREKDLNWRLSRATSIGLVGEEGVHHLDIANWFFRALPISVFGLGGIREYQDGRDIDDTVQCIVEYPNNVQLTFDGTLVSSYDSAYNLYMGSESSVLLKDSRAWMFKEADSPALGWEVYARQDRRGDEEGIALVADATKQLALGKKPADETPPDPVTAEQDILKAAVETFLTSIHDNKPPSAGWQEGYQATVLAIKAHEAVLSGTRITLTKDLFELS